MKKNLPICAISRYQNMFHVVILMGAGNKQTLFHCESFTDQNAAAGIKNLTEKYGRNIRYGLTLHFSQYHTTLLECKSLNNKDLNKSLRWLLSEETDFHAEECLSFYYPTSDPGKIQVFYTNYQDLQKIIAPLNMAWDDFYYIDSFDSALTELSLQSEQPTTTPTILVAEADGLVRCILLNNGQIQRIAETSLLANTNADPYQILSQKLRYYFSSHLNQSVQIVSFNNMINKITQLPTSWHIKQLNISAVLAEKLDISHAHLPSLGSAVHHATYIT